MADQESVVYIVHSIDTEGPLFESLEETFKRIEQVFGIKIEPTQENLSKLQHQELDLDGSERQVAKMLSPEFLDYNDNYAKLDDMLERIGSSEFRNKITDSFGGGWVYNWHCVDHLGYSINPRRKDMGYHNIYDHYHSFIKQTDAPDQIYWHFHPSHHYGISNLNATMYFRDPKIYNIIARRILERNWFPSVNRAGFHTERPDSHWFLEQWIPFDLSNQSFDKDDEQPDTSGARFGDWRRAPSDWSVYQPHHDDYQVPGDCRRHIGRCLNVGTRMRCINKEEMEKAFEYAKDNGSALMGVTNHDFREMGDDVDRVRKMATKVAEKYPNVKFKYADAREAFNQVIFEEYTEPDKNILSIELEEINSETEDTGILHVEASEEIYGPQPFLAIKTIDGDVFHDNFDFEEPFRKWSYTFDFQTFPVETVQKIGVATNDKRGFYHIQTIDT